MLHKSYSDLLNQAVQKFPLSYGSYVVKRRGKIIPADQGLVFETDKQKAEKKLKKQIPSVYNSFNNRRKPVQLSKTCWHCGEKFDKRLKTSFKDWATRIYCSPICGTLAKKK